MSDAETYSFDARPRVSFSGPCRPSPFNEMIAPLESRMNRFPCPAFSNLETPANKTDSSIGRTSTIDTTSDMSSDKDGTTASSSIEASLPDV